jgi:predicted nucleotidyltransferase component of viral defense system
VNAAQAVAGVFPPSDEPPASAWETVEMLIESPHPYGNQANLTFPVEVAGAKKLRVIFDRVETENSYDKLSFEDENRNQLDILTGNQSNYTTDYVNGSKAIIRLRSDSTMDGWGFIVTKVQVIR